MNRAFERKQQREAQGLVLLNPHHMNLICAKSWGCNETTTLAKLTQGRRT